MAFLLFGEGIFFDKEISFGTKTLEQERRREGILAQSARSAEFTFAGIKNHL